MFLLGWQLLVLLLKCSSFVTEMTVNSLMPSSSTVLLIELPCVKTAAPDICNMFIYMGEWVNDIKKKQASGQSRQDSFCWRICVKRCLLPVGREVFSLKSDIISERSCNWVESILLSDTQFYYWNWLLGISFWTSYFGNNRLTVQLEDHSWVSTGLYQ